MFHFSCLLCYTDIQSIPSFSQSAHKKQQRKNNNTDCVIALLFARDMKPGKMQALL